MRLKETVYYKKSNPKGKWHSAKPFGKAMAIEGAVTPGKPGPGTGEVKILTDEEIQKLYPGVTVNRKKETHEEYWRRVRKVNAARRAITKSRGFY